MPLPSNLGESTGDPPPATRSERWSLRCENCAAAVRLKMDRCGRCGAPQAHRSFARAAAIAGPLVGLGAVAAIFALCVRLLGE